MRISQIFLVKRDWDKKIEHMLQKEPVDPKDKLLGDYIIMPRKNSYALGVSAIKSVATDPHPYIVLNGAKIRRPLSLKENIEVRVNDYETLKNSEGSNRNKKERLRLFKTMLDSCTGIAYKSWSMKFKIIPICKELILVNEDLDELFLTPDYNSLEGIELDRGTDKYNDALTKEEVLEHSAWRELFGGDMSLLRAYANIVYEVKKERDLLYFWVKDYKTRLNELREIFITAIQGNSGIDGECELVCDSHFLKINPKSS